jgi:nitrite reductase/ring-hydroxylating ferredoxin subunit
MKTKVMDLANLPLLTPVLVTVDGTDVFLYRRSAEGSGPNGDIVTFPLHGWEFDLRTGVCMTIPGERVPGYRATVEDGAVYLDPAD